MSMEIEWPEYHYQGMGCGLEDRSITDRYDAMQYGWDEAAARYASEVVEPLTARIEELENVLSKLMDKARYTLCSSQFDELDEYLESLLKK